MKGALCSFDPDTQVVMADGTSKAIKDVRVGDKLEAGDPTKGLDQGGRAVTALHDHTDDDLFDVTVTGRDGRLHSIHTTARHPFWDDTTKAWAAAAGLSSGHSLKTVDGHDIRIAAVARSMGNREMTNLTVDELHTFYVKSDGEAVLVHNTCNIPGRNFTGPDAVERPFAHLKEASDLDPNTCQQPTPHSGGGRGPWPDR